MMDETGKKKEEFPEEVWRRFLRLTLGGQPYTITVPIVEGEDEEVCFRSPTNIQLKLLNKAERMHPEILTEMRMHAYIKNLNDQERPFPATVEDLRTQAESFYGSMDGALRERLLRFQQGFVTILNRIVSEDFPPGF